MPILFRQCKHQDLSAQDKKDLAKLFEESTNFELPKGAYWLFGDFNQRIAGAMAIKDFNSDQCECLFLAVRKPTRNRGVGSELLKRWPKKVGKQLKYSSSLPGSLKDFIQAALNKI